jgi:stage III sporulation protein AA
LVSIITPAQSEIRSYLPPRLGDALDGLSSEHWTDVEEIRLRTRRPVVVCLASGEAFLARAGGTTADPDFACLFSEEDARLTIDLATRGSVYAVQEQLASGYLTLPGGHRLGLAGRAVVQDGQLRGIRHVASYCLRLAREVRGAADPVLPWIVDRRAGRVLNTLLVSPPRCGKTTVLRDAIRQLSGGAPGTGIRPCQVSLVDERSEVAGSWQGVPARDVGPRTDVLDACPKAAGMVTMLRSMAPDVIATDEIGREEDVAAIEEAANAGVAVLATAHAWNLSDLQGRPTTGRLLSRGAFARLVFLGRSRGPGTLESVLDGGTLRPLHGTALAAGRAV